MSKSYKASATFWYCRANCDDPWFCKMLNMIETFNFLILIRAFGLWKADKLTLPLRKRNWTMLPATRRAWVNDATLISYDR